MAISRRKFIKSGVIVTGVALFLDAFWIEHNFIQTNEFFLNNATEGANNNIKIVQISDIHIQILNSPLEELAEMLNKLQPDLIVFTGDVLDRPENITVFKSFIELIDVHIPKASILGNWEYWANVTMEELNLIYKNNNCRLLINQGTQFKLREKTFSITGVDDFVAGDPDIIEALKWYQPADYHIILNHCPQYTDQIRSALSSNIKADLILSGHTHGGQVNLFGFCPYLPKGSGKYVKGWYDGNPKMYVSKGIGTSIFPIRLGSRAEVAVFNFPA